MTHSWNSVSSPHGATARVTGFVAAAIAVALLPSCADTASAQQVGSTARLSVSPGGEGGNASSGPIVAPPNAPFVVFVSSASNLVTGDTNFSRDVFLRDLSSGSVSRINLGPGNEEADDQSQSPTVSQRSPNGVLAVAYQSDATNIARSRSILPDTNVATDIFVTLPFSNVTERVSVAPGPVEANGPSRDPSVVLLPEPNRVLVAYASDASNLVGGDTNGFTDVFLTTATSPELPTFSLASGLTTIRLSRATDGTQANSSSGKPAISGNGKFVVFESTATNLVQGIAPSAKQIYRYEVDTGTVVLISRDAGGLPGNADSQNAAISYSGDFVVYLTAATNLINDGRTPTGTQLQVVRYQVSTGAVQRVNVAPDGSPASGADSNNQTVAVSADARLVTFADDADSIVPGDANGVDDTFVRDAQGSNVVRLSSSATGSDTNGASFAPVLGADGYTSLNRFSSFVSDASNLVLDDDEGRRDVFTRNVSIAAETLNRRTVVQVPPDVSLAGTSIGVAAQPFADVSTQKALSVARASKRPKLQYRVEIRTSNTTGPTSLIRRRITSRNRVSFNNLPSGTYTVRYRPQIVRAKRVVVNRPFSPDERVTVG